VVELPHNTDVRGFVETVRSQYPGAELVARHDREQSIQSSADVWTRLEAELTDRQSETLQIAYHSGFYEWPRETTGEEVAAAIGVSQPTVSRHLRACERKLLGMFLGPR
jgi:predicted DNA binding protein